MIREEINNWVSNHPSRYMHQLGLLETYVILFDCSDCPDDNLKFSYIQGLERIKKSITGK